MELAEELRRAAPSVDMSQERAGYHGRLLSPSQDALDLLIGTPAEGTVPLEVPVHIEVQGSFLGHKPVHSSMCSGSLGQQNIPPERPGGYLLPHKAGSALDGGNPARLNYSSLVHYPMGSGTLGQQIMLEEPPGRAQVVRELAAGQPAILSYPTHGLITEMAHLPQRANTSFVYGQEFACSCDVGAIGSIFSQFVGEKKRGILVLNTAEDSSNTSNN